MNVVWDCPVALIKRYGKLIGELRTDMTGSNAGCCHCFSGIPNTLQEANSINIKFEFDLICFYIHLWNLIFFFCLVTYGSFSTCGLIFI